MTMRNQSWYHRKPELLWTGEIPHRHRAWDGEHLPRNMELNLDVGVEDDFGPQPSGDSSPSTHLLLPWLGWQRSAHISVSGKIQY